METTKSLYRERAQGLTHEVLGMRHVYKATAAETGGAYVAFEIEIPPGCGAPPHRHAIDSESFFVLEGEIEFAEGGATRTARAGDFAYLPSGGEHAFANRGAALARALVVAAPGVEAERFFAAVDAAFAGRPAAPAEVVALAARHGLTISPPA